jgi:hypothetical protein
MVKEAAMTIAIDNQDYETSEVPHWEEYMEQQGTSVDVEALKKDIKKLNAQATNLKMNLHDLAEDLPIGWEKIPEVAAQAYEAYKNLTEARSRLAASGG